MAANERLTDPPDLRDAASSPRPRWPQLRFALRSLMLLPILAAISFMIVDRWTAIPWTGPTDGSLVVFKIVDGSTGQEFKNASLTLFEGGEEKFTMDAPSGVIRHFGGNKRPRGYRSLVRDTRRLDVGDMQIKVTANGFEDFRADAAEISRNGAPSEDDSRLEYVVRLRKR
jgi:hypothetical protein